MRRYLAVIGSATLAVAIAGCAGVPSGASPSAGSSASADPRASPAATSPHPSPSPSRVRPSTPTAKPASSAAVRATQVPTATSHLTAYVVKAGDTLYAIAIRFKVTMKAILAANPGITNSNQVVIGQKIFIPSS